MGALRDRLSYANVMATVAVFLALAGGVAWAIGKNSVGPRQIRPDAVRSSELKTGAVKGPDIRAGAIGSDKLGDGAVTTQKLADEAATGQKIDESSLGQVPSAGVAGGPANYAHVTAQGEVVEARSRGITDAMVTQIVSGVYCVHGAPQFSTVQITPHHETIPFGASAPQWITSPDFIKTYCTDMGHANGQGVVNMVRITKPDGTLDGTVDPAGFDIWFGS